MNYPYGKAPLAILIIAILSGIWLFIVELRSRSERADLIFAVFAKEHAEAYRKPIREFEIENNVRVQLQLVDQRALQSRLQASLQVGAEVPDVVELLDGTMGLFTNGPLEDVGLLDLTDRLRAEGLDQKIVSSRFGKWSSRGRIFAVPHDIHPVALAYRRDIVEQLGIDVSKLTTWEEFARVGREVVRADTNNDGVIDRYMIDLPADGGEALRLLLLQQDIDLFDADGRVVFDQETVAQTILWYVRQFQGPDAIAYPAGWGQTLSQSMNDGLVLFYIAPDWRTKSIESNTPALAGRMGLMPLPAWTEGGRRTSSWGGTGLAIPKSSRNPDLAWKLMQKLYFNDEDLGRRFRDSNILPPVRSAWSLPEFGQPSSYWGGQSIGKLLVELAEQVPQEHSHPYQRQAIAQLNSAFGRAMLYHRRSGEDGLIEYIREELKVSADRVRAIVGRNRFLNLGESGKSEHHKEAAERSGPQSKNDPASTEILPVLEVR